MPQRCLIPSCFGKTNRSVFRMPKTIDRREKWLNAIRDVYPHLGVGVNFSVCEKHFREIDFTKCMTNESGQIVQKMEVKRKRLKSGAVPHFDMFNLNSDNNLLIEQDKPRARTSSVTKSHEIFNSELASPPPEPKSATNITDQWINSDIHSNKMFLQNKFGVDCESHFTSDCSARLKPAIKTYFNRRKEMKREHKIELKQVPVAAPCEIPSLMHSPKQEAFEWVDEPLSISILAPDLKAATIELKRKIENTTKVKQEPEDTIQVKQELEDTVQVKQELEDTIQVKQELEDLDYSELDMVAAPSLPATASSAATDLPTTDVFIQTKVVSCSSVATNLPTTDMVIKTEVVSSSPAATDLSTTDMVIKTYAIPTSIQAPDLPTTDMVIKTEVVPSSPQATGNLSSGQVLIASVEGKEPAQQSAAQTICFKTFSPKYDEFSVGVSKVVNEDDALTQETPSLLRERKVVYPKHIRELSSHRKLQEDPLYRELKRARERAARRKLREDPVYRELERARNRAARRKLREDPVYREAERARDRAAYRKLREDHLNRDLQLAQNSAAHHKLREDPVHREAEHVRNTAPHRKLREDPVHRKAKRARDTAAHRKLREDPLYRESERARNTAAHRKLREDPVHREVERARDTAAHRKLREDPLYREAERARNKAARRKLREDPVYREVERARNSAARRKLRKDPVYRDSERAPDMAEKMKNIDE